MVIAITHPSSTALFQTGRSKKCSRHHIEIGSHPAHSVSEIPLYACPSRCGEAPYITMAIPLVTGSPVKRKAKSHAPHAESAKPNITIILKAMAGPNNICMGAEIKACTVSIK
jgi:hypothetical protein